MQATTTKGVFFLGGFIEGITNAIPLKVLALASVCVHQRLLRPMIDGTEMDEVKIIQWDPFGWTYACIILSSFSSTF